MFEWVAANVAAKYSIGNSFEGELVIKQFILFDKVPFAMQGCKGIRIEYLISGKCLLFVLSLLQCTRVRLECVLLSSYGFLGYPFSTVGC